MIYNHSHTFTRHSFVIRNLHCLVFHDKIKSFTVQMSNPPVHYFFYNHHSPHNHVRTLSYLNFMTTFRSLYLGMRSGRARVFQKHCQQPSMSRLVYFHLIRLGARRESVLSCGEDCTMQG